jgi:hypothetical protein
VNIRSTTDGVNKSHHKYHLKKGIATLTVILRQNKFGLLPNIRVLDQCPTACDCKDGGTNNYTGRKYIRHSSIRAH